MTGSPLETERYDVNGHAFEVSRQYELKESLGSGAYGVVCSAIDNSKGGQKVAIKKIKNPFNKLDDAKRLIREVRLLHHFRGQNYVLGLLDILKPLEGGESEQPSVYFVTDLLDTDLRSLLKGGAELSSGHISWFMSQLVSGVDAVHSARVIHRDLKPENIFVSKDCSLKIGDFGLARDDVHTMKSVYVVTRWYRAPELLMNWGKYNYSVDIWSVGCIFAEMLSVRRKPIFPGSNFLDQLNRILYVIGTPEEADYDHIESVNAKSYLKTVKQMEKKDLRVEGAWAGGETYLPASVSEEEVDFLFKTLAFDPRKRPSAKELLKHPYLDEGEEEEEEEEEDADDAEQSPSHPGAFDPHFESLMTDLDACKQMFSTMVHSYHPSYDPKLGIHPTVTANTASQDSPVSSAYDAAEATPPALSQHSVELLEVLSGSSEEDKERAVEAALLGPEKGIIEEVLEESGRGEKFRETLLRRFSEAGYEMLETPDASLSTDVTF